MLRRCERYITSVIKDGDALREAVGHEVSHMAMKKVATKKPAIKAGTKASKKNTSANGKRGRPSKAPALMSADKALETITIGNFAKQIGNVDTSEVEVAFDVYKSNSARNKGKEYLNLVIKTTDADGKAVEKLLPQPSVQLIWNALMADDQFLLKVAEFMRNIPQAN